jgi:hypothetical protein
MHRLLLAASLGSAAVGPLAGQSEAAPVLSAQVPVVTGLIATMVPVATGLALLVGRECLGRGGLTGRGFGGLALRMVTGLGGLMIGTGSSGTRTAAGALVLTGAALATGLAIRDLATLDRAVHRRRARTIAVGPTYLPAARGPAVVVRLTF